jgi:hypothetical protein
VARRTAELHFSFCGRNFGVDFGVLRLDWGLGDASISGGWQLEDEHAASVGGSFIGRAGICGCCGRAGR